MMDEFYSNWNKQSPIGLLLVGLGISLIGQATLDKENGRGWFWKGTVGLIFFNAGLAVFGDAIKNRALYENELNKLRKS